MFLNFTRLRTQAAGCHIRRKRRKVGGTASVGEPQYNYATILDPLTKSGLSKLISRMKTKYGRENELPQNPLSVVTDFEEFLAPSPTESVHSESDPRPKSLTPSAATSFKNWPVHDTCQPDTLIQTTVVPTSSSMGQISHAESSNSWATTRGSSAVSRAGPSTPWASNTSLLSPTHRSPKTLRRVNGSGNIREMARSSPGSSSETFSSPMQRQGHFQDNGSTAVDIDRLRLPHVQDGALRGMNWCDATGLSTPTHRASRAPRQQQTTSSVQRMKSFRERLTCSDSKDTESLNNIYDAAHTPDIPQVTNKRFFENPQNPLRDYQAPSIPSTAPRTPQEHQATWSISHPRRPTDPFLRSQSHRRAPITSSSPLLSDSHTAQLDMSTSVRRRGKPCCGRLFIIYRGQILR